MKKTATQGPCREIGCGRPIVSKGMCATHYRAKWVLDRKAAGLPQSGIKGHPLYITWRERKHRDGLCEAWSDFHTFVRDVGDRPSEFHFLARRRPADPYGPDNFHWREQLRREPGETQKEFWARKWQSRKEKHPTFERRRHLVRRFGITTATYEKMLLEQSGVCAICQRPETKTHKSTGEVCSLAVDHNHDSGRVRGLLCWKCNAVLGRIGESQDILRAMIEYIDRWNGDEHPEPDRPAPVKPKVHEIVLETEWGPMLASDAARRVGLRPATVLARIRYGWAQEDILTPLRRPNWRKPKEPLPA